MREISEKARELLEPSVEVRPRDRGGHAAAQAESKSGAAEARPVAGGSANGRVDELVRECGEDEHRLGDQRRDEELVQAVERGLRRPAFPDPAGAPGEGADGGEADRDLERGRQRAPLGGEDRPQVIDGGPQPLLARGGWSVAGNLVEHRATILYSIVTVKAGRCGERRYAPALGDASVG
jgi:hypothetical protein